MDRMCRSYLTREKPNPSSDKQERTPSLSNPAVHSPRTMSSDSGKKTRATSCTNCRQVKLKCDLKERYPNPCTRCATHRNECKTDSSFKRVPTRSRIRDLESQLNKLKRNKALERASPLPSVESSGEFEHRIPSPSHQEDYHHDLAMSERLSYGSPSDSDFSPSEVKWLNITESNLTSHFILDDTILPCGHALELFRHFEDRYFPHFCILQPISSLRQLQLDSEFLFWSIALISARHHHRHWPYFNRIRKHIERLHNRVIAEAIQSLLDLQAILLLCTFPCQDPQRSGWAQVGMAVNAARQMGLDRHHDDVTIDISGIQNSVNRHPRHIRQMTWMKCFELDVQMSCWHGHLPNLAHAHSVRTVASFCDSVPFCREYAAIVSIHVELAQCLLALEDGPSSEQSTPSYLGRILNRRSNAVKVTWSSAWTLDAELELLTAQLYLYSAYLISVEDAGRTQDNDTSLSEALKACGKASVQLLTLQTTMNAEIMANLQTSGFCQDTCPLPGRSEHTRRSAWFAACVLLRILDETQRSSNEDHEAARNAFSKAYQMFTACSSSRGREGDSMFRALEVVGRVVGHGPRRLRLAITTRMGASIRLNVMSLATELGSGAAETVTSTENSDYNLQYPSAMPAPITDATTMVLEPYMYATTCGTSQPVVFTDPIWNTTAAALPTMYMPFGAWDHYSIFGDWQDSMGYLTSSGIGFDSQHQATTMA